MCLYSQRTHDLFGNRVDSFSTEPVNTQAQQMTNQRPLKFSESQPESPPNSAAMVPATEFFPTIEPKSNTNNNAFAEWVSKTRRLKDACSALTWPMCHSLSCLSDIHLIEKEVAKTFTTSVTIWSEVIQNVSQMSDNEGRGSVDTFYMLTKPHITFCSKNLEKYFNHVILIQRTHITLLLLLPIANSRSGIYI